MFVCVGYMCLWCVYVYKVSVMCACICMCMMCTGMCLWYVFCACDVCGMQCVCGMYIHVYDLCMCLWYA